jgi:MFS family permease
LRRIDDKNLLGSLLKRLTILLAIQLPLTVALAFARSEVVAYGFYACEVAIFAAVTTYMVAPIQLSVPNRMRGRAAGLFMTFNYLIGASLGPAAVGLLSDHMKGATHGLLTAFVIVLGVSCAASIFMFYLSATRKPASCRVSSLDPIEAPTHI